MDKATHKAPAVALRVALITCRNVFKIMNHEFNESIEWRCKMEFQEGLAEGLRVQALLHFANSRYKGQCPPGAIKRLVYDEKGGEIIIVQPKHFLPQ